ncbi:hypothetical protein EV660_10397 [Roseinatronobacter bogoriensis DSM 18756]|nr:hypothetical protein [Rhodobaca bogoriensis DSM 18756]TDY69703.1 hypothetical protein EV660_10397 [Rhodobaca bogoriensis DSM 18756]
MKADPFQARPRIALPTHPRHGRAQECEHHV